MTGTSKSIPFYNKTFIPAHPLVLPAARPPGAFCRLTNTEIILLHMYSYESTPSRMEPKFRLLAPNLALFTHFAHRLASPQLRCRESSKYQAYEASQRPARQSALVEHALQLYLNFKELDVACSIVMCLSTGVFPCLQRLRFKQGLYYLHELTPAGDLVTLVTVLFPSLFLRVFDFLCMQIRSDVNDLNYAKNELMDPRWWRANFLVLDFSLLISKMPGDGYSPRHDVSCTHNPYKRRYINSSPKMQ